jgi:hypothetical protein
MKMGTEVEPQRETMWSHATECTEYRQNDRIMNSTRPDLQSSSTVKVLHPAFQIPGRKEEFAAQKEKISLGRLAVEMLQVTRDNKILFFTYFVFSFLFSF